MLITRDDFRKAAEAKKKERQRSQIGHLELLHQAAVRAELLTGDPQWDTYMSFLQDTVNKTQAIRSRYEEILSDPNVVDDGEMRRAKIGVIECTSAINALEAAISLPKMLKDTGEIAKDMIAELGLAGDE